MSELSIVGIGGSTRPGSSSERALAHALGAAQEAGATVQSFDGTFLSQLPLYAPENSMRSPRQQELVRAVQGADGLIVATPGYHGGVSGLVKNALDLLEDLRDTPRPYLDGRAVACIVTATGWQACGTTLVSLRSVVHALRGWPTPLGVTLNTLSPVFTDEGAPRDERTAAQLELVAAQVVGFARAEHAARAAAQPPDAD
jgi:FMN reductase